MINYIEKGIGLHAEIERQGYRLWQLDGVWMSDNDTVVQEIINNYQAELSPNWDSFNTQMLTDGEFNQVYNTANSVAPVICSSLPAALTQVSNGQFSMFNIVWNQIMNLGNATAQMRIKWAGWANDNNLPSEFVAIIGGV